MKEYKEFPPVLYLFLIPPAFGGIFLGSQFVILGLIYWLIGTPFAKHGSVIFAVLFILIDIPTILIKFGAITAFVILFQVFFIWLFLCFALILKFR